MALESIHACDCSNGFTYVGEISIQKVSGLGGGSTHEEVAVSNYFAIETKTLVDRTWRNCRSEDQLDGQGMTRVGSVIRRDGGLDWV